MNILLIICWNKDRYKKNKGNNKENKWNGLLCKISLLDQ